MARNRNKEYKQGDRINIYLSRDVSDEFIDWINTQSDLSNFFLYAALSLYEKTGFVDVSEIMPRKINFNLSSADRPSVQAPIPQIHKAEPKAETETQAEETISPASKTEQTAKIDTEDDPKDEEKQQRSWASLEDFDDPFA